MTPPRHFWIPFRSSYHDTQYALTLHAESNTYGKTFPPFSLARICLRDYVVFGNIFRGTVLSCQDVSPRLLLTMKRHDTGVDVVAAAQTQISNRSVGQSFGRFSNWLGPRCGKINIPSACGSQISHMDYLFICSCQKVDSTTRGSTKTNKPLYSLLTLAK